MNAIIFSAGLGTRLLPLTNNCPKALVKINGQPLLWHAINKLIESGVTKIVVNIHHFGEQIIDYLGGVHFKVPILISDERHDLLDTGGGLLKAKNILQGTEPIIAYNVDVISSVNLKDVVAYHLRDEALATLVVRKRETSRYLMFDEQMKLAGWTNVETGEKIISTINFDHSNQWAFSGIQVLSPGIFDHITEKGKFPITQLYLRLAKEHTILGYADGSDYWIDLGKPTQIELAGEQMLKMIHLNMGPS